MTVRKLIVPKEVFYGWGAVEALRNWPGKRAFIVTDKTRVGQGHAEKVAAILRESGYRIESIARWSRSHRGRPKRTGAKQT